MLLGEIRDYLKQRGNASLQDVAIHFDIAPETAELALHYWQKKGKIRAMSTGCGSAGCSSGGCSGTASVYEWTGREIPLQWQPS